MTDLRSTVDRDALVRWLDEIMASPGTKDYGPNGLQVEGKEQIQKIVTGVSACHELFVRAREAGADAIMVHHGIFWDWQSPVLTGMHFRRVAELLDHRINLIAYHLPLDRHPEIGNNALAARGLGLLRLETFVEAYGLPVGIHGRFPEPIAAADLVARCREFYGQEPLDLGGDDRPIERVGIVSGAGQKAFPEVIDLGLDAFITGEVSEWITNTARETGIRYLACGHYATEVCGIRALGEKVAERFGIEVELIDVPNPV